MLPVMKLNHCFMLVCFTRSGAAICQKCWKVRIK